MAQCLISKKIEVDCGYATLCWLWPENLCNRDGYGIVHRRRAHKVAWELEYGRVPLGKELHHNCFQRACWRPAHIEALTHKENMQRTIDAKRMYKASWTQCHRGHELAGSNLRLIADGRRVCKMCAKLYRRRTRNNGSEELKGHQQKLCKHGHDLLDPTNRLASRGCRQCMKIRRRQTARERSDHEQQS